MIPAWLEAQLNILRIRFLTNGGTKPLESIAATATSKGITLLRAEYDASYGVIATPDWDTTIFITSKTTTGFTLNFGTAAPGGGGSVDWAVIRSE